MGIAVPGLLSDRLDSGKLIAITLISCGGCQWALRRSFRWSVLHTRQPNAEAIRWLIVAGIAAWLINPYATRSLVGLGDARFYAQQLADAGEQLKEGVFPLLVGQSPYALNGDIHPLRTAPYFQYVGGSVMFFTGQILGAAGTQNLLIVVSFIAAVLISYIGAVRLLPRSLAWFGPLLALAWASSPGVLALVYSGDLIASWMALPYLVIVLSSTLRIAMERGPPGRAWIVLPAALAMIWLSHAPIAFWTTVVVGIVFVFGIGHRQLLANRWRLAGAAGLSGGLCVYIFASVASLNLLPEPSLVAMVRSGGIMPYLKQGWDGFLAPIDVHGANLLHNLQLSPVLWLAVLIGASAVFRNRVALALTLCVIGFLALILPSETIAGSLWRWMPESVINATEKWPMQRFYPILTTIAVSLSAIALGLNPRSRTNWRILVALMMIPGLAWSLFDARKFLARGRTAADSIVLTENRLRASNAVNSRYSFEMYGGVPSYFGHGAMRNTLGTRLLTPDSLTVANSNFTAILAQPNQRRRTVHKFTATGTTGTFTPALRLRPGTRYLLLFIFDGQSPGGFLNLVSKSVYREHYFQNTGDLPELGPEHKSRRTFIVQATGDTRDELTVNYHAANSESSRLVSVLKVAFDEGNLPFQVERVIPFTVRVQTNQAGWVETPKLFIPGYTAKVNGLPVSIARSPEGLAMVQIEPGNHVVELTYQGAPWLRFSFWITAAAWMAYLIYVVRWHRFFHHLVWLPWFGKITGAAAVLFIAGSILVQIREREQQKPEIDAPRTLVSLRLPTDQFWNAETIAQRQIDGQAIQAFIYYSSHNRALLGFSRNGRPFLTSEPFPLNYRRSHDLDITWDTPNPKVPYHRFRLTINHRLVLDKLLPEKFKDVVDDLQSVTTQLSVKPTFSGEIFKIQPMGLANLPQKPPSNGAVVEAVSGQ